MHGAVPLSEKGRDSLNGLVASLDDINSPPISQYTCLPVHPGTQEDFENWDFENYNDRLAELVTNKELAVDGLEMRIPKDALKDQADFVRFLEGDKVRSVGEFFTVCRRVFADLFRAFRGMAHSRLGDRGARGPEIFEKMNRVSRLCIDTLDKIGALDCRIIPQTGAFCQHMECISTLLQEREARERELGAFVSMLSDIESKGSTHIVPFPSLGRVMISLGNWDRAIKAGIKADPVDVDAGRKFMAAAVKQYEDDEKSPKGSLDAKVSCPDYWDAYHCDSELGRLHYVLGDMYNISTMVEWYRLVIDLQNGKGVVPGQTFATLGFCEPTYDSTSGGGVPVSVEDKLEAVISTNGNAILLLYDSIKDLYDKYHGVTPPYGAGGVSVDPDYKAVWEYIGVPGNAARTKFEVELREFIRAFVKIPFHLDSERGSIADEHIMDISERDRNRIIRDVLSAGDDSGKSAISFKGVAGSSPQAVQNSMIRKITTDKVQEFIDVVDFARDGGEPGFRKWFDVDVTYDDVI
jgi:hypothetical protein